MTRHSIVLLLTSSVFSSFAFGATATLPDTASVVKEYTIPPTAEEPLTVNAIPPVYSSQAPSPTTTPTPTADATATQETSPTTEVAPN